MADETFSSIAQGYVGAQSTLRGLGMLPGSFHPMDGRGAAPQLPTPPIPPQLIYRPIPPPGNTLPFPASAPQFSTPRFSAPQMQMHHGGYPPRMGIMGPQQGGYIPPAPVQPSATGVWDSMMMAKGWAQPGFGQNVLQTKYQAQRRWENISGSAGFMGRNLAFGAAGGLLGAKIGAGFGAPGILAGGIIGGLGASMGHAAVENFMDPWVEERQRHAGLAAHNLRGVTSGNMVGAFGRGINPLASMQISNQFLAAGKTGRFHETVEGGDLSTTLGMGGRMGLTRGYTNDVSQIVSRVKTLAEVSKSIMALGEGITQQDAMQLQALSQQMGIGTDSFKTRDLGRRLVIAARTAGVTMGAAAQGAFGQGGAIFQRAGMSSGLGALTGLETLTTAGSMASSGMFSAGQLASMGGQGGIQRSLMGAQTGFMARNMGNLVLGAMNDDLTLDSAQAQANLLGGGGTFRQMALRGKGVLKGQGLTKRQVALRKQLILERMPELTRELQEDMDPMEVQDLMIRQVTSRMEEGMAKGKMITDTQAAASLGIGAGQWRTVRASMKNLPDRVRDINRQERLVQREGRARSAADYDEYTSLGSRVGRAMDRAQPHMFTPSKWAWVKERQEREAREEEAGAATAAGIDLSMRGVRNLRVSRDYSDLIPSGKTEDLLKDLQGGGIFSQRQLGVTERARQLTSEVNKTFFLRNYDASDKVEQAYEFLSGDSVSLIGSSANAQRQKIYDKAVVGRKTANLYKMFGGTAGAISASRQYMGSGLAGDLAGMFGGGDKGEAAAGKFIAESQRQGGLSLQKALDTGEGDYLSDLGIRLADQGSGVSEEHRERVLSIGRGIAARQVVLTAEGRGGQYKNILGKYISSVEDIGLEIGNQDFLSGSVGGRQDAIMRRLKKGGVFSVDDAAKGALVKAVRARPLKYRENLAVNPMGRTDYQGEGPLKPVDIEAEISTLLGEKTETLSGAVEAHLGVFEGTDLTKKERLLASIATGTTAEDTASLTRKDWLGMGVTRAGVNRMRMRLGGKGDLYAVGKRLGALGEKGGFGGLEGLRAVMGTGHSMAGYKGKSYLEAFIGDSARGEARDVYLAGLQDLGFKPGGEGEGDSLQRLQGKGFLTDEEIESVALNRGGEGGSIARRLLSKEFDKSTLDKWLPSGGQLEGAIGDLTVRSAQSGDYKDLRDKLRGVALQRAQDRNRQGGSPEGRRGAAASSMAESVTKFKSAVEAMGSYSKGTGLKRVLDKYHEQAKVLLSSTIELEKKIKGFHP